jgi:O-6-methylguanine DNA methyltransferase
LKEISYDIFDSSIGTILVASTGLGLCLVSINREGRAGTLEELRFFSNGRPVRDKDRHGKIKADIRRYLNGERVKFKMELDISIGTEFQRLVWRGLLNIPYGKTRSYKQIAENIGCPRASRAVGQANGRNPLPIIFPCHRVINSNGSLGGYSGGIEIKRRLLAIEGIYM